jgi:dual-specificity kinase
MTEDWKREFYKNGYPREVIVIEDSPTPSPLNYATTESTISSSPYNRKRYADHQQQPINTKRSKWNDTASNSNDTFFI